MAIVRKTVTFTEQQNDWIKAQIASGDFTNDSEYLRNLVRKDQEQNSKFLKLKAAIQEGIDSGISDMTIPQIWKEVEEKMRSDGRL